MYQQATYFPYISQYLFYSICLGQNVIMYGILLKSKNSSILRSERNASIGYIYIPSTMLPSKLDRNSNANRCLRWHHRPGLHGAMEKQHHLASMVDDAPFPLHLFWWITKVRTSFTLYLIDILWTLSNKINKLNTFAWLCQIVSL